jgi:hypothetical protein
MMRLYRIGLTAVITVLATLVNVDLGFPVLGQLIENPKSKIPNSQMLAQTPDARKAEADRLLQQGIQQAQTSQFEAALQSWQQALIIYREIKDHKGEGKLWVIWDLLTIFWEITPKPLSTISRI